MRSEPLRQTAAMRLGSGRPGRLRPSRRVARCEVGGGQACPVRPACPRGGAAGLGSSVPAERCFCSVMLAKSSLGTPAKRSFLQQTLGWSWSQRARSACDRRLGPLGACVLWQEPPSLRVRSCVGAGSFWVGPAGAGCRARDLAEE